MSDEVLLSSFTITRILDCIADPRKNRVIARFSEDVSPVFPYLNAVVPNLMYNPATNSVTIKRGERILTFYPDGAVMAKVDGAEDALAQLQWFQDLCNEVWRRRAEITPCYERRNLIGPLEAYRLLPRLNCGDCGKPTCMAFAAALLQGDLSPGDCPHLWEDRFAPDGRLLAELLGY